MNVPLHNTVFRKEKNIQQFSKNCSWSIWFVVDHCVTDAGLRKLSFGRGTKLVTETSESNHIYLFVLVIICCNNSFF